MENKLKIHEYISGAEINKQVRVLADKINNDFKNLADTTSPIYAVCILKGAILFYTELIKHINLPLKTCFITLSSYGNDFSSSGNVKVLSDDIPDLNGQNVLIVEDLIDMGITLDYFTKYLKNKFNPNIIKTAVLLSKKRTRKTDFVPDYYGFEVEDKFIVGFGMDYKGLYRNLDYIGYVDLEE